MLGVNYQNNTIQSKGYQNYSARRPSLMQSSMSQKDSNHPNLMNTTYMTPCMTPYMASTFWSMPSMYYPGIMSILPPIANMSMPVTNVQNTNNQTQNFHNSNFRGNGTDAVTVRTTLTTSDEKKKYKEIYKELNSKYRKKLDFALKTGILLKNNSNDNSSVLDNLHKILKTERDPGLDGKTLLKECLDIINNPYSITQTCEDIPNEYKTSVLGLVTNMSQDKQELKNANAYLDNMHTGTCPTASVEFDLATRQHAEFFRMVEGLTSPKGEVQKIVDLRSLSKSKVDAADLLTRFRTPHQMLANDKVLVTLKPDKNAIIRARIQNNHRDKGERSSIDILMQSTMMQLGSAQTYDSLTDKRGPSEWSNDDGGLVDIEKTYVETIMCNKCINSVIYQELDGEGRLVGYHKDFATTKSEIMETLARGQNVIIGYTWPDPENGNKLAGHEITIVGAKQAANGETIFICQDSDDNYDGPIEMSEKELIPKLHHAGIPEDIAERNNQYQEGWQATMDSYNQYRNVA